MSWVAMCCSGAAWAGRICPEGDAETLAQSIERVLYTLPDGYTVWPGHGPRPPLGEEKAANPFVNGAGVGMMQR